MSARADTSPSTDARSRPLDPRASSQAVTHPGRHHKRARPNHASMDARPNSARDHKPPDHHEPQPFDAHLSDPIETPGQPRQGRPTDKSLGPHGSVSAHAHEHGPRRVASASAVVCRWRLWALCSIHGERPASDPRDASSTFIELPTGRRVTGDGQAHPLTSRFTASRPATGRRFPSSKAASLPAKRSTNSSLPCTRRSPHRRLSRTPTPPSPPIRTTTRNRSRS